MVDTYQASQLTGFSPEEWKTSIIEISQMLVDRTGCSVVQVLTDSGNDYSVLMYAGDSNYFVLSTTDTNGVAVIAASSGFYGASYYPLRTVSQSATATATDSAKLWVVNRGDVWGLSIPVGSNWLHLRGVKLRSSLDNRVRMVIGLANNTATPYSRPPFPHANIDRLLFGTTIYRIWCHDGGTILRTATDDYHIILFPDILATEYDSNLGVPTVNGKLIYLFYGLDAPAFTEFFVGDKKFVSLGNVAIRST